MTRETLNMKLKELRDKIEATKAELRTLLPVGSNDGRRIKYLPSPRSKRGSTLRRAS